MAYLFKPNDSQTRAFTERERVLPYSYVAVGSTQNETPVLGFDNDFNFIALGQGEAVWEAAKEAIRQWKMFPGGWACIWPERTPLREGEVVAMLAKVMGLWWLNSCRIVYVIDNQDKFGFAYGTLPGHAECGEELFMVEKTPDGTVRYVLKAFSRPRVWLARLGYPIARAYQRKFIRDSKASMVGFVRDQL
ncbi:MAG: DUF1990 domain-containing protein [Lewinellaceae bacterium]|nr:DUF1990 domain-containing protein [Lewinellaceae bacterium]